MASWLPALMNTVVAEPDDGAMQADPPKLEATSTPRVS